MDPSTAGRTTLTPVVRGHYTTRNEDPSTEVFPYSGAAGGQSAPSRSKTRKPLHGSSRRRRDPRLRGGRHGRHRRGRPLAHRVKRQEKEPNAFIAAQPVSSGVGRAAPRAPSAHASGPADPLAWNPDRHGAMTRAAGSSPAGAQGEPGPRNRCIVGPRTGDGKSAARSAPAPEPNAGPTPRRHSGPRACSTAAGSAPPGSRSHEHRRESSPPRAETATGTQSPGSPSCLVSAEGIEPSTYGLRVHCSAS